MNPATLTAAHRSLKFGTKLKVTNRNNGRSVIVRANDRGPFIRGRVLDLSRAAAQNIGMVSTGTSSFDCQNCRSSGPMICGKPYLT